MSIREHIAVLEELSSIDVDLRRIEEQLDKHHQALSGMQAEVKLLEDRAKADRETLAAMDKTRSEFLSELRQMTQKIDRSREKLQRSRNNRESNAAQRELETVRKLHRDREEELTLLNAAADEARTAIDVAEKKHASLSSELSGVADRITSDTGKIETDKATRTADRARVVTMIPPALYRRYESIRTRRPVAIAKTHDGTCLALLCHRSGPGRGWLPYVIICDHM